MSQGSGLSRQFVIVGMEWCGKSFWTQHYANKYAKQVGGVLVYNVGMDKDYEDYEFIELLDFDEHERFIRSNVGDVAAKKYAKKPSIMFFRYKESVYHLKYLSSMFFRKKLKCHSLFDREESEFFKSAYAYLSRMLLIMDDTRVSFSDGLKKGHRMLMSRKRHAGGNAIHKDKLKRGVDIVTMFHGIDLVNKEVWNYSTDLLLFRTTDQPSFTKIKDGNLKAVIKEYYDLLINAPKYTCFRIPLRGEHYLKAQNATLKI